MRFAALVAIAACGSQPPAPRPLAADTSANVALAKRAWLAGDLERSTALLATSRDPEAPAMLARLTGRGIAGTPHVAPDVSEIGAVALSANGALVAGESVVMRAAPSYWRVRVYDVLTGRDRYEIEGKEPAFAIDPATGATLLVVETFKRRVSIHAAATGAELHEIQPIHGMKSFAVDARGTLTIAGGTGDVEQFDVSTGQKLNDLGKLHFIGKLQVAEDSRTIVSDRRAIRLQPKLERLFQADVDLALSVDGRSIAYVSKAGRLIIAELNGVPRAEQELAAGSQLRWLVDDTLLAITGRHVRHIDRAGVLRGELELPVDGPYTVTADGHVLARDGGFAVFALGATARLISRFGGATFASALAWTDDGGLAIAHHKPGSRNGDDLEVAIWHPDKVTVRDLRARYDGTFSLDELPYPRPFAERRVFAYGKIDDLPTRYWELETKVAAASSGGGRVAALDDADVVHLFDAITGEGLGEIDRRVDGIPGISAIALRGDGKQLAIARRRGGVEVWDLPSRSLIATFASATTAFDASGAWQGEPELLTWSAHGIDVGPATAARPLVAANAIAHPPAAVAFAPTPAPVPQTHACVPAKFGPPVALALSHDVFSFCFSGADRYCFTADLVAHTLVPSVAPASAFVDREPGAGHSLYSSGAYANIQPRGKGIEVCTAKRETCHELPIAPGPPMAASDDAAIVAVDVSMYGPHAKSNALGTIETWDAVTGKKLARFPIEWGKDHALEIGPGGMLMFFDHALLAFTMPCSQPCSTATMYTPRGKALGTLAVESTSAVVQHFHDHLWTMYDYLARQIVVQDSTTGAHTALPDLYRNALVTSDRIVGLALGPPRVQVWGANLELQLELPVPVCAPP